MRLLILSVLTVYMLSGCVPSWTDYADNWTKQVKKRITEDANQVADRVVIDSVRNNVTLFRGDRKLKLFYLNRNDSGNTIVWDTALSVFYSADQQFELVRELCPVISRSFEGVRFKGKHYGVAEFRYCDGKIMERGYRFNGNVGVWKEYDVNEEVVNEKDYGNVERLKGLREINYEGEDE